MSSRRSLLASRTSSSSSSSSSTTLSTQTKKYTPNFLHVSPTSLSEAQRLANRTTGIYLTRTFNVDPPESRMMPGKPRYLNHSERLRMGIDCDEVYPGIIIGTGETVKNIPYLLSINVTHVLNTAECDVNVNPKKYAKEGICYKGFRVNDVPHADISQFFDESVEFIDRALSFSYGVVFVNCLLGLSRSTAIVMAYLMKKKNMSASEALMYLRKSREVKPNVGFLQQLGKLDDELRAQRYRRI